MPKGSKKKKKKNVSTQNTGTAAQNTAPKVNNDELKAVLASLKEGNSPEKQEALRTHLQSATLIAPAAMKTAGAPVPGNKAQINFFQMNTKDGKSYFPAFTDNDTAATFRPGPNVPVARVVIPFKEYGRMFSDPNSTIEGLVLNPGIDNIIIPKKMIQLLCGIPVAAGPAGMPAAPQKPSYAEPKSYPTRMMNAVYDYCAEHEEISRVWMKNKIVPPTVSYLLIVEADRQDQDILDAIKAVAEPLAKEVPVETAFYTEELEKEAIQGAFAAYDRLLEL